MVSGFLISPYDQYRIFSGLAIEILIWSKLCGCAVWLKRFMTSWFMTFSWFPRRHGPGLARPSRPQGRLKRRYRFQILESSRPTPGRDARRRASLGGLRRRQFARDP